MGPRWLIVLFTCLGLVRPAYAAGADDTKQQCVAAADDAQALRDAGKYAKSRIQFMRCADPQCPAIVSQQCTLWLEQLVAAMPTVVLAASDGRGHDLLDVRVFVDGKRAVERLSGAPTELDPGPHELRFEQVDRDPAIVSVVLRAGEKNRPVTAALLLASRPQGNRSEGGQPTPAPSQQPPVFWDARTVTAVSLLTAGVLSAGVGGLFSISSHHRADDAAKLRASVGSSDCFRNTSADCLSLSRNVDAQTRDATLSTALYLSGGTLLAASAIAWFAWPRGSQADATRQSFSFTPAFGPGYAGLHVASVLP